MASIFTKIIRREIPAYIVAEDDRHIAFLDIFPVARGHVLVVPKKETDKLFDLDEEEYGALMLFARRVAKALEKVFPDANRIGMAVIGLEVPHVHVHLVPINRMSDMNFENKLSLPEETFRQYQREISEAYQTLYGS